MDESVPAELETPYEAARLWRRSLGLMAVVLVLGIGWMAVLALGIRTATPERTPDATLDDLEWQLRGAGMVTVTEKGYRVRLTEPDQYAWVIADRALSDFEIELEVRANSSSEDVGYGLLYRYRDAANGYLFAIGGDGYYAISRIDDSQVTPLRPWRQWPHVRRGADVNRLRVQCDGDVCRFFINDEFTAEIEDDASLEGRFGLSAQTFSDSYLDVHFAAIKLWLPD